MSRSTAIKARCISNTNFCRSRCFWAITQNGVENDTQWSVPEVEKTFWGERQHRLFIEDIRNDTSNSLSARDGFITLATMEAVCRSCESGTWETPSRPRGLSDAQSKRAAEYKRGQVR